MSEGYEYQVVETCVKTGRPYVTPVSWFGNARLPGKQGAGGPSFERQAKPIYSTCQCCPATVTETWIDNRLRKASTKHFSQKIEEENREDSDC